MKRLFFAAILATVAAGSAYAQQYTTQPNGAGTIFSCINTASPTCRTDAPRLTGVYNYPTGQSPVNVPSADVDKQYVEF